MEYAREGLAGSGRARGWWEVANGVAEGPRCWALLQVWAAGALSWFGVEGTNKMFGHHVTLDEHGTKDQY